MPFPWPDPVLAVDPGAVIGIVILVISFLGWILNLANKANPAPPPIAGRPRRPPQAPPREDRLQSEIDIFLEEVSREKPPREARDRPTAVNPEPPGQPRPPGQRPPGRRRPPQAPRPAEPVAAIEPPRPAPPEFGEGRGPQFSQSMADRVARTAREDEAARIAALAPPSDEGIAFGSAAGTLAKARTRPVAADEIVALLRNPAGVKQAIIVSEILSPPRTRRKRG